MAFEPYEPRTPARIPVFRLVLEIVEVWEPEYDEAGQTATYRMIVVDKDGAQISYKYASGDAVPHMTAAQQQSALALMQELKALAVQAIVG